jgi:phosphoribosylanthranilate isomerase
MVKVKICGITNLEDALNAADAGCDAVGFIFYKQSQRYITPEKASKIIRHLPPPVLKIGVFVDGQEKTIRRVAKLCHLDMLQFHGKESPGFCARFGDYKIIKAFRVKKKIDVKDILKYNTFAYLFDTFVKSKRGGTGRKFDWSLVADMDGIGHEVFLSGGLTARNVKEALGIVRPDWVDVCSSVEISPGKKDNKKVSEFIEAAK